MMPSDMSTVHGSTNSVFSDHERTVLSASAPLRASVGGLATGAAARAAASGNVDQNDYGPGLAGESHQALSGKGGGFDGVIAMLQNATRRADALASRPLEGTQTHGSGAAEDASPEVGAAVWERISQKAAALVAERRPEPPPPAPRPASATDATTAAPPTASTSALSHSRSASNLAGFVGRQPASRGPAKKQASASSAAADRTFMTAVTEESASQLGSSSASSSSSSSASLRAREAAAATIMTPAERAQLRRRAGSSVGRNSGQDSARPPGGHGSGHDYSSVSLSGSVARVQAGSSAQEGSTALRASVPPGISGPPPDRDAGAPAHESIQGGLDDSESLNFTSMTSLSHSQLMQRSLLDTSDVARRARARRRSAAQQAGGQRSLSALRPRDNASMRGSGSVNGASERYSRSLSPTPSAQRAVFAVRDGDAVGATTSIGDVEWRYILPAPSVDVTAQSQSAAAFARLQQQRLAEAGVSAIPQDMRPVGSIPAPPAAASGGAHAAVAAPTPGAAAVVAAAPRPHAGPRLLQRLNEAPASRGQVAAAGQAASTLDLDVSLDGYRGSVSIASTPSFSAGSRSKGGGSMAKRSGGGGVRHAPSLVDLPVIEAAHVAYQRGLQMLARRRPLPQSDLESSVTGSDSASTSGLQPGANGAAPARWRDVAHAPAAAAAVLARLQSSHAAAGVLSASARPGATAAGAPAEAAPPTPPATLHATNDTAATGGDSSCLRSPPGSSRGSQPLSSAAQHPDLTPAKVHEALAETRRHVQTLLAWRGLGSDFHAASPQPPRPAVFASPTAHPSSASPRNQDSGTVTATGARTEHRASEDANQSSSTSDQRSPSSFTTNRPAPTGGQVERSSDFGARSVQSSADDASSAQHEAAAVLAALYSQLVQAQKAAAEAAQESAQLRAERDALRSALAHTGGGAASGSAGASTDGRRVD
jgi:hypothetical protein